MCRSIKMDGNVVRDTVYLTDAFRWICPNCRVINYNAAVADELTDDGIRDALCLDEDFEIDDIIREELELYKSPANVKCKACEVRYKAIDSIYTNDEDDLDFDED